MQIAVMMIATRLVFWPSLRLGKVSLHCCPRLKPLLLHRSAGHVAVLGEQQSRRERHSARIDMYAGDADAECLEPDRGRTKAKPASEVFQLAAAKVMTFLHRCLLWISS
jgi:hypothetical protein